MKAFNSSHVNPTTRKKLVKAMFAVLKRGSVEHVRTAKGDAYLAVRKFGEKFEVLDKRGINVASAFKKFPQLYSNLICE